MNLNKMGVKKADGLLSKPFKPKITFPKEEGQLIKTKLYLLELEYLNVNKNLNNAPLMSD